MQLGKALRTGYGRATDGIGTWVVCCLGTWGESCYHNKSWRAVYMALLQSMAVAKQAEGHSLGGPMHKPAVHLPSIDSAAFQGGMDQ